MSEMMNVRPVTSHDIAAALNLSVNTVRVYLGKSEKKSATCIRVQEYAKKVGYDPKAAYEYNQHNRQESIKHYHDTPVITYYRNGTTHSTTVTLQNSQGTTEVIRGRK